MEIDGDIASDPNPRVSVIILTYNGIKLLRQCLPSVLASTYSNLEIIVADNASKDGSADWVASTHPSVVVVRHPENLLFCAGNNRAVDHASGEYIVLLNNDVEVEPSWLEPLLDCLESDSTVGAVQPKLLQYQDRSKFEYAGGAGGHIDRYGYPFTRGRLFFDMEVDSGQYDEDAEIFWATGAALCTRRDVYQNLGGLDERFEMHMEEIDLCWRLQRIGLSIRSISASRAYHIGGASLPHGSPRKTYLNYRNNILTLYKNLSPSDWLKTFPVRVLLDGIGIVRFLALLKFGEAFAVVRAYGAAHFMKGTMKNERPKKGERAVLPHYRRSIVLDYFVFGHRRFSDLRADTFSHPENKRLPKSID
jgi:GT2 family glycosyltransferase